MNVAFGSKADIQRYGFEGPLLDPKRTDSARKPSS